MATRVGCLDARNALGYGYIMSEPTQIVGPVEPSTLDQVVYFLSTNIWVTLTAGWICCILAITQFVKLVLRAIPRFGDTEETGRIIALVPFVVGGLTGWAIAPEVASTTTFVSASMPWYVGSVIGFGVGWASTGVYEQTRGLKIQTWSKILVNKAFGAVVNLIPGAKLTKAEEDAVAPTVRKQPPFDPSEQ